MKDAFNRLKGKTKSVYTKPTLEQDLFRFRLLGCFIALFFIILCVRAFYLQIIAGDELQEKSLSKVTSRDVSVALRGVISDRNGVPLAVSTQMKDIGFDPIYYDEQKADLDKRMRAALQRQKTKTYNQLKEQAYRTDLKQLAVALNKDPEQFVQEVDKARKNKNRFLKLLGPVSPEYADEFVKRVNTFGLSTTNNYQRYYPQPQPNAQIVGTTDKYGRGIEGLERQLDKRLTGEPGQQKFIRDGKGNRLALEEVISQGKPGENISLSIDSRLQYVMYRELASAGVTYNARSASAIAVDVKTGEILAMNSWPSYNPNNDWERANRHDAKRNRGAVDSFEPGSTVKPLTVMLALQSGKFNANSVIDTSPGRMKIGNHTISDTHNYGALTPAGILIKSSNIGATKLALALPHDDLPNFYRTIGFGQKTSAGFIGESVGIMRKTQSLGETEIATMSYGYGLNVTILQLAQAYAMIANHGVEMPLTLYKRTQPVQGRQVVKPEIADSVLLMLEQVTQPGGTAKTAVIPGYRVGGKTGTAHKVRSDGKGYEANQYRAVFAGIAPISQPRIALIVVVENPQGQYYGGLVAAPVFAKIMQESLRLLNVPFDKPLDVSSGNHK